jgi:hypothetical protein
MFNQVESVAVPEAARQYLPGANYADAYQAKTGRLEDALSLARKIVARTPAWVGKMMAVRNILVAPFGLVRDPAQMKSQELVGFFPLLSATQNQVILGLDDKHLDFRIVLDVVPQSTVTLTTLVETHNFFGRLYLKLILPFHRRIAAAMLRAAG